MKWRASFRKKTRETAAAKGLGIAVISILFPDGSRSEREVFITHDEGMKLVRAGKRAWQATIDREEKQ